MSKYKVGDLVKIINIGHLGVILKQHLPGSISNSLPQKIFTIYNFETSKTERWYDGNFYDEF
jgi:hypothetical protein